MADFTYYQDFKSNQDLLSNQAGVVPGMLNFPASPWDLKTALNSYYTTESRKKKYRIQ
jgi:hypothetical protein